jgi:hypothetical protein
MREIQELFVQFLSLPDTHSFVKDAVSRLSAAEAAPQSAFGSLSPPRKSQGSNPLTPESSPQAHESKGKRDRRASDRLTVTTRDLNDSPRSPRRLPKSPKKGGGRTPQRSPKRSSRAGGKSLGKAVGERRGGSVIKQFFFPNGAPISPTTQKRDNTTMGKIFRGKAQGLTIDEFIPVAELFWNLGDFVQFSAEFLR